MSLSPVEISKKIPIEKMLFQVQKYEKWLKKFNDGKGVSAPQKVSGVFQKIPFEKMGYQVQKYEKYLKSKNDFKRPLGPFNKKLWPI